MIKIEICGIERNFEEIYQEDIVQQFRKRRAAQAGFTYCVTIRIGDINLWLASVHYTKGGPSGGRDLNHKEKQVFEHWQKCNAENDEDPQGLIRFLGYLSGLN